MSQAAGLDVRWPLGLLFAMIGALLLGHGLTQGAAAAATHAPHINTWWGGAMLVFGLCVLWLARRGSRKTS